MKEKSKQYLGLLFELKISLNEKNSIVIDYGGKPVGKIREDDIKQIIQNI